MLGEELPLIGMRNKLVIHEDGISPLARAVLKRESDEVAKSAARKRVLIGKEAVVRLHAQLVAPAHRLGNEIAAHLAGGGRGHRCREEEPDVGPVAGAGPLDGAGETSDATGFNEGRHVIGPGRLVEVCRQEPTPLIGEQWVNANDVTPLEVVEDHLVFDREECLVWTLAALHPGLLADAADPLVPTGRRVPLAPRPCVAPEPGVDILPASKA